MRPKVSVIVPFYNSRKYIRESIESLLNQTLNDLEIICVDDGSTDGTYDIVLEYKRNDDRIILISKPNKGYGHSMNLGFSLASGEYVGILESDDYVAKNMFERLYSVAKKNDLDFVKSDFSRFYREDGIETNIIDEICKKNKSWYNVLLNPSIDPSLLNITMNTWTGIYKLEFIKNHDIRHNETPGASFQDNGFWFQTFCLATRAMFINEVFYNVRRDNPDSSVKDKGKVYCMSEEYNFILNFLSLDSDRYNRFIYMYHRKKYHNYIFTLNRIDDKFRMEFLKFMQKEFLQALHDQELERDCFTEVEWQRLTKILKSPQDYYISRYGTRPPGNRVSKKLRSLLKQIDNKAKFNPVYVKIRHVFNNFNFR